MSAKRYPPVDSLKAARAKEKRRKPLAEDRTTVRPIIIKSHLRRMERKP